MSITNVLEIGFGKRRSRYNTKYVREYTRVFRLYTDEPQSFITVDDIAAAASIGAGLPQLWDAHPDDDEALVKEHQIQENEDPQKWECQVEYSSDVDQQDRQADNPLDEPPEVSWDQEDYEAALDRDLNDNAIANTASDAYDPPPTARKSRLVLTIEQNQAGFNYFQAQSFTNTINETLFLGQFVAGQVYCRKIGAKRAFKNRVPYFRTTYVFVFGNLEDIPTAYADEPGASPWDLYLLDAGHYYLSGGQRTLFRDSRTGQPLGGDQLLDGSGGQLALNGTPVYNRFPIYPAADYSLLPLNLNV